MADEHTKRMFRWRNQVLADNVLSGFQFKVAYAVADRTFRSPGYAEEFQSHFARMVGGTVRGVQKALARLEERGHLKITVNRKLGRANFYLPIVRDEADDAKQPEGTNDGSYPCNGGGEPPFVPPANRGSDPARTPVRTDPLEANSESSEKDIDRAFEEWWTLYPRHAAKRAARKAYGQAIAKKRSTVEKLKLDAMRYANQRSGQDPQYTLHPATWLNGDRWNDEPISHGGKTNAAGDIRAYPTARSGAPARSAFTAGMADVLREQPGSRLFEPGDSERAGAQRRAAGSRRGSA
jgi:hypothetical protein